MQGQAGPRRTAPDVVRQSEPVRADVEHGGRRGQGEADDVDKQVQDGQVSLLLDHALEHGIERPGRCHVPLVALRRQVVSIEDHWLLFRRIVAAPAHRAFPTSPLGQPELG